MLAAKGLGGPPRPIREVDDKKFVADNVYFMEDWAWKRWKFEEAIKELRLCNHPSLGYSNPEGLVIAKIELNLKAKKRDQYMDGFTTMTPITHAYDRGIPDKSICAFVTSEAMGDEAVEAGAIKTGGEELIKEVLIDVSRQMPENMKLDTDLKIEVVECLTKPRERVPFNPWSKSWRIRVENRFKEHILRPEAIPDMELSLRSPY